MKNSSLIIAYIPAKSRAKIRLFARRLIRSTAATTTGGCGWIRIPPPSPPQGWTARHHQSPHNTAQHPAHHHLHPREKPGQNTSFRSNINPFYRRNHHRWLRLDPQHTAVPPTGVDGSSFRHHPHHSSSVAVAQRNAVPRKNFASLALPARLAPTPAAGRPRGRPVAERPSPRSLCQDIGRCGLKAGAAGVAAPFATLRRRSLPAGGATLANKLVPARPLGSLSLGRSASLPRSLGSPPATLRPTLLAFPARRWPPLLAGRPAATSLPLVAPHSGGFRLVRTSPSLRSGRVGSLCERGSAERFFASTVAQKPLCDLTTQVFTHHARGS